MKLVIEIGAHDGGEAVTHRVVDRFPLRIGRGYNNDIILPDPHVSADHAEILHNGTDWVLRDIGSENGCQVNGKPCEAGQARLHSGDRIVLGRSVLRVFDPHHPVLAAQRLERSGALAKFLARPRVAWEIFAAAILLFCLLCYLEYLASDIKSLVTIGCALGAGMILWAALWSVAGRLARNRSNFHAHISIIGLFLIANAVFVPVLSIANFLASENLFARGVVNTSVFLLLSALIYASLAVATRMTARWRATAACSFSAGLVGIMLGFAVVDAHNFNPQPTYATTMRLYLHVLARAETLESFMAENDALFDDRKLDVKDDDEAAKTQAAAP